jgi:hypothetical protein
VIIFGILTKTVPNGGYVTGVILEVVKTHFATSLSKQDQPHTIALHIEFLRRTQAGPATFKVDDVKLGRQTSIVHISMEQDGRQEIIAYVTNSNMDKEEGFSFDTEYKLTPPVLPVDLKLLENDTDPNWKRQGAMPFAKFRKASSRVTFHFPRNGHSLNCGADEWLQFRQHFDWICCGYVPASHRKASRSKARTFLVSDFAVKSGHQEIAARGGRQVAASQSQYEEG